MNNQTKQSNDTDEMLHKSFMKQIKYLKFQIKALAAAIAACYLTF